jgi:hypothetical protein
MQGRLTLDEKVPDWIGLLQAEAARGRSVSDIAREAGIARSSLSMLLRGVYPADSLELATRRHAARVTRLYQGQILCPHLQHGISAADCRAFATAPMSTSNPGKLRH